MKMLLILVAATFFTSCNTSIGLWRDTKAAGSWSARKIQEAQNGGGGGEQEYEYGAPVY